MNKETIEMMVDAFDEPRCRMPSTLLMGALLSTGLSQEDLNARIESVLGDMGSFSKERPSPFSGIFVTNVFIWSLPDNLKGAFFSKLTLSTSGLLTDTLDGVDELDEILKKGKIEKADLIQFYTDLKLVLEKSCEGFIETESVARFLEVPNRMINHLNNL